MKVHLCLLLLVSLSSMGAAAADPPAKLSPLTPTDQHYMGSQRELVDSLARIKLGRQIRGEKHNDLGILQALLDKKLVTAPETLELQAMGIVMGNLLAAELNLSWVIHVDRYGRTRALQLGNTDHFLFPVTSISRRVEARAKVTVVEVYAKLVAAMRPHMQPLPFQ